MGAYSPAPVVTPACTQRVMREVILPTVRGMAAEGNVYTGFLYAGPDDRRRDGTPKVIEFNCRFGDPETQPIMMRLQSDLVALCDAALDGQLDAISAEWDPRAALGVVLAAGGYPGDYAKGDVDPRAASTRNRATARSSMPARTRADGDVVTSGGRVLCVTALGDTVAERSSGAYAVCATDRLGGRVLPPRHRLSRHRARAPASG